MIIFINTLLYLYIYNMYERISDSVYNSVAVKYLHRFPEDNLFYSLKYYNNLLIIST